MKLRFVGALVLAVMACEPVQSDERTLTGREAQALMGFVASLDDAQADAYVTAHMGQLTRALASLDMTSEDDRIVVRYLGRIIVRGGCSAKLAVPSLRKPLSQLKDDSVPLGDLRLYPPTSTYGSLTSVVEELEARPACPQSHAGGGDLNADVQSLHHLIEQARTANDRAIHMRQLVDRLSKAEPDEVEKLNDSSVALIAEMLRLDGDVGRFYAGLGLSAVSCRAKSALPDLRLALSEAAPVWSDSEWIAISPAVSPYEEIQRAIARIESDRPCSVSGG